jgi:hypothetical protein
VSDQTTLAHADTILLDFIASEYLDVSAFTMPTGAGDADVGWKLVQEHEGKKGRVEVACHYRDDLRAAIREAMQALGHSLPSSDSAAGDQKPNEPNPDVSAYIASLVAERDALAADAERYRWLRDKSEWYECHITGTMQTKFSAQYETLDAAIDAARLSAKGPT